MISLVSTLVSWLLGFPIIICHPHFRWFGIPPSTTRVGPAETNGSGTSTGKPSGASHQLGQRVLPITSDLDHYSNGAEKEQFQFGNPCGHVDLTVFHYSSSEKESEMKTSEQNGSSKMVWFFGVSIYTSTLHIENVRWRKCLVLTFQAADFLTSQRWRELSGWSTAGVQGHWATVGGRTAVFTLKEVGGVLGFKLNPLMRCSDTHWLHWLSKVMNMIDAAKRFPDLCGTTLQTYDLCHARVST